MIPGFLVAAGEGFEPSHTESESAVLPLHNPAILWSCWADSNRRPHPYQGCALPTELQQHIFKNGDPERARTVDLQRDRLAF